MASPAVTYTFANSTTADASQVNTNFTDLINGMTDTTKDFSISALTLAGALTANGHVTLGNSTVDDITFTGSMASTLPIKTTNSFNIGSATLGLAGIYFGSAAGAFTTRIIGGAAASSLTITLPTSTTGVANSAIESDANGVLSFSPRSNRATTVITNSDSPYTATLAHEVILCNAASGAITVNLPAASTSAKKTIFLKKTDSSLNAVTIDGNASETIDGSTTKVLSTQYESIMIICDGSNWHILDRKNTTGWVAYTPTITGFGTVSGVVVYSRRNGQNLEVMGKFTAGTVAASTATITVGFNGTSANVTCNTAIGGTAVPLGYGIISGASASFFHVNFIARGSDGTTVAITATTSALGGQSEANGNTVLNSSDLLSFSFSTPIVGWEG